MRFEDRTTVGVAGIDVSYVGNCFVSKITKETTLRLIDNWIRSGKKDHRITAVNVGKLVMLQTDKKLSGYVMGSAVNIADGFPIYLATRLLGDPIPERITGVALMEDLLRLANTNRYSVYFLGSQPQVLKRVVGKCRREYPNLKISGHRHGYFSQDEIRSLVREIACSEPDILFVALGLPQKEYFVDDHGPQLNASVVLPVGGAFDVYAGVKKRAPSWVQKIGAEWLWRSAYDRSRALLVYRSVIPFSFILIKAFFRQRVLKKTGG